MIAAPASGITLGGRASEVKAEMRIAGADSLRPRV